MKKIKIFFAAAILCAISAVGYNVYTNATMTEQERLTQANLEALTSGEENIWNEGYTTGTVTIGGTSYPCCVKSSITNSCNSGSLDCIAK